MRGPPEWSALPLLHQCCAALAGSFKISQEATVGGNVCLALPAGPMIALTVGLDDVAVWASAGGERRMLVAELVTGVRRTTLDPGDVLRAVEIPDSALRARTAPGDDDAWAEHEAANLPIVWCDWSTPTVQSSESRSAPPPSLSRSPTVSGDRAGSHGHHAVSAIMAGRWAIGRIRKRILPKDRSGPAHDRYLSLLSVGAARPELLLQQVPERKHGKNRLHLDLRTRDLDAEVDRVQQAGATRLTEQPIEESGWRWHVLADLDGNEFCILQPPTTS